MAMTVKELREALENLPDDLPVVMSKDSEGNAYSPLSSYADDVEYVAETTWYGELYSKDEDERPDNGVDVLCLWPTN